MRDKHILVTTNYEQSSEVIVGCLSTEGLNNNEHWKESKVGQQIALWAQELSLEHPAKKTEVGVRSLLKQEFPWICWETIRQISCS